MNEPTRPLQQPSVDRDGNLRGKSLTTPVAFKIRGALLVPSRRVIPVILVPGIMGSNLKAKTSLNQEKNKELEPGEAAWRMPNSIKGGLQEAKKWKDRQPQQRQRILDPATLEVDDMGEIELPPFDMDQKELRKQGWGEVHADSYGHLLHTLHTHLNRTLQFNRLGDIDIADHWRRIMEPAGLNAHGISNIPALTKAELVKHADFQYPVYACGYNWLESSEKSAARLERRILDIIDFWSGRKHECGKVILITHSMGGLVARACAKRIPGQIAGVVHGVMPALGAPICYRRIACGTEASSPSNGALDNVASGKFAEIAGETPDDTTAAMATAAGVLELLPNHLYPGPWLFVSSATPGDRTNPYKNYLRLPQGSPYDLYRDIKSWYRLINPELADPAKKYANKKGGVEEIIGQAINQAEKFHTQILDDYYHPNTYAYYGTDPDHLAFGHVRWIAHQAKEKKISLTHQSVQDAKYCSHTFKGGRNVEFGKEGVLYFEPAQQNERGDDTVPDQSGSAPSGKIKQIFAVRGFAHQDSFKDEAMLMLTQYLIVKISQDVK